MEQNLNEEISLKELVEIIIENFNYLISKWLIIFFIGVFGALAAFLFTKKSPIKYSAHIAFMVEESKSSLAGLVSLASQFGLDPGNSSSSGLFTGENLILLLKSESLIRETLLSPVDSTQKKTLADFYAEISKLKNNETADVRLPVNFKGGLPIREEIILQNLIGSLKNDISVTRPDKRAAILEIKTTTQDEQFSILFNERIIQKLTERYVKAKVKIKEANVAILQKRADSLALLLNRNTYNAAISQQPLVDLNPALRTAPVSAEISSREKLMIAAIFSEVIKNLEFAKISLQQEAPFLQIIDRSYPPLPAERTKLTKSILIGGLLAVFLTIVSLLFRRWWKSLMMA